VLGLAIVKKVVDEHFGVIAFADRIGGGTVVKMQFDPVLLRPFARDADDGEPGDNDEPPSSDLTALIREREVLALG